MEEAYLKNIQRIFPSKQDDVRKMVEVCQNEKNVKKIIIFGSATTNKCNSESDIDIFYEFEQEPNAYPSTKSNSAIFDKWDNFNVDDRMLEEIRQNGVLVYER